MVIQQRADPVLKFSRLTNSISKRLKKTSDIEEVEQAGVLCGTCALFLEYR